MRSPAAGRARDPVDERLWRASEDRPLVASRHVLLFLRKRTYALLSVWSPWGPQRAAQPPWLHGLLSTHS